jgi:hypothetical protein
MPTSLAMTARTQFLDAGGTRFAYRRFVWKMAAR